MFLQAWTLYQSSWSFHAASTEEETAAWYSPQGSMKDARVIRFVWTIYALDARVIRYCLDNIGPGFQGDKI
jgi:hypothetical protein